MTMSDWRITPSNNDLLHYGVLGMKWGIRRYQNKDGSLTTAGKRKYYKDYSKLKTKEEKKEYFSKTIDSNNTKEILPLTKKRKELYKEMGNIAKKASPEIYDMWQKGYLDDIDDEIMKSKKYIKEYNKIYDAIEKESIKTVKEMDSKHPNGSYTDEDIKKSDFYWEIFDSYYNEDERFTKQLKQLKEKAKKDTIAVEYNKLKKEHDEVLKKEIAAKDKMVDDLIGNIGKDTPSYPSKFDDFYNRIYFGMDLQSYLNSIVESEYVKERINVGG